MVATLLLEEDGDLLLASHPDGATTIFVGSGARQVTQAVAQNTALKQGSVWFDRAAGIDYDRLFYNSRRPDEEMEAIRAAVISEAVLATPGVEGFVEGGEVTITRQGRTLIPDIPCININCENGIVNAFVGVLNGT